MGGSYCCVVGCKNTNKNSDFKFYKFPDIGYKKEQKMKWIAAINRRNPDGSQWIPKPYHTICSEHFVGHKKAEEQRSPSYVPTIFPLKDGRTKKKDKLALDRHKRLLGRKAKSKEELPKPFDPIKVESNFQFADEHLKIKRERTDPKKTRVDRECQVNFFL